MTTKLEKRIAALDVFSDEQLSAEIERINTLVREWQSQESVMRRELARRKKQRQRVDP